MSSKFPSPRRKTEAALPQAAPSELPNVRTDPAQAEPEAKRLRRKPRGIIDNEDEDTPRKESKAVENEDDDDAPAKKEAGDNDDDEGEETAAEAVQRADMAAKHAASVDPGRSPERSGSDVAASEPVPSRVSAKLNTRYAKPEGWRDWPEVQRLPSVVRKVLRCRPARGLGEHHTWLYRASCTIHEHTDWPQADAVRLFEAMTRGEDMGPGEIMDAIYAAWSSKARGRKPIKSDGGNSKPRPSKWPGVEDRARDAIIQTGGGLAALKAASSHRIDAKAPRDPARYLRALFDDGTNPLICQGKTKFNFLTRPLLLWLEKSRMLTNSELVVPSPMTAIKGLSKKGKIAPCTSPRFVSLPDSTFGSEWPKALENLQPQQGVAGSRSPCVEAFTLGDGVGVARSLLATYPVSVLSC